MNGGGKEGGEGETEERGRDGGREKEEGGTEEWEEIEERGRERGGRKNQRGRKRKRERTNNLLKGNRVGTAYGSWCRSVKCF